MNAAGIQYPFCIRNNFRPIYKSSVNFISRCKCIKAIRLFRLRQFTQQHIAINRPEQTVGIELFFVAVGKGL